MTVAEQQRLLACLTESKTKLSSLELSVEEYVKLNGKLSEEKVEFLSTIADLRNKESLLTDEKISLNLTILQLSQEVKILNEQIQGKDLEIYKQTTEVTKLHDLNKEINSKLKIQIDLTHSLEHKKTQQSKDINDLNKILDQKSTEIFKLQQLTYLIEEVKNLRLELENRTFEYQEICDEKSKALEQNRKLSVQIRMLISTIQASIGPFITEGNYVNIDHLVRHYEVPGEHVDLYPLPQKLNEKQA